MSACESRFGKEVCIEFKWNVVSCCTAAHSSLKVPINTSNMENLMTQKPTHNCHNPSLPVNSADGQQKKGTFMFQVSLQRVHSYVHM